MLEEYVAQLMGRKHLIVGNHDEYWLKNETKNVHKYFESINYMDLIKDGEKSITLCHYPMFEWNRSRYIISQEDSMFWHVHGHIHNTQDCDAYKLIREKLVCALNAGVDINNFEPVTFEELLANNNKWYGRT